MKPSPNVPRAKAPIAAIASTLIDVVIHDRDPAAENAPTVLFASQRSER